MYDRLNSPLNIKSLKLKNRMVIPAVHTIMSKDGACTERFLNFYKRRAEGGIGLIIVGSCRIDEYGADANSMSLASDDTVESWKNFNEEIHKAGSRTAVQLFHAGRYVRKADVICGKDALSPSETFCNFTRETAPEMSRDQIEKLLGDYAAAAKRAVKAGFDAVEISGSSGYLLCQFLSPLTNKRTDEYGGSAENRRRFPLEVIRRVREAVGTEFPIFYRLGADDLVKGSNKLEDILEFVGPAAEAGIDCFNVTGGWHESLTPQLTGDVPEAGLYFLPRAVREKANVPVIINNRVNSPAAAEKALALGDADLAGVGRACIADPDFPIKAREGRPGNIRPCVACNQACLANVFFGKPIACHVNPEAGREQTYRIDRTKRPKKILVIGAGPAGCEAALRCAQAGHDVSLWEEKSDIGGQLILASRVPGKSEYKKLIGYYKNALNAEGVKVTLGRHAEPDNISGFDRVILACGGREKKIKLNIEGDARNICSAKDIIAGKATAGKRTVVIGGSFIGCETARYLADDAALNAEQLFYLSVYRIRSKEAIDEMLGTCRRDVILIEKGRKIGYAYEAGTSWPVLQELKRLGVKTMKETEVTKVTAAGVWIRTKDSEEKFIECDTVAAVNGVEPDDDMGIILKEKGIDVISIGNQCRTGKSIDAIKQGYEAALKIQ